MTCKSIAKVLLKALQIYQTYSYIWCVPVPQFQSFTLQNS